MSTTWLKVKKYPKIIFGTYQLGGSFFVGSRPNGYSNSNEGDIRDAIKLAIKNNINIFDTANFYGYGKSEIILGELVGRINNVKICTKIGQEVINGQQTYIRTIKDFERQFIESSKRLRRNKIDLVYLHSPIPDSIEAKVGLEFLRKIKSADKIGAIGISVRKFDRSDPSADIKWAVKQKVDVIQFPLNLFDPATQFSAKKFLKSKEVDLVARMPFSSGMLSAKEFKLRIFPTNDHRSVLWPVSKQLEFYSKMENGLIKAQMTVDNLKEIAWRYTISNQPNAVLVGINNSSQIKETLYLNKLPHFSQEQIRNYIKGFGKYA